MFYGFEVYFLLFGLYGLLVYFWCVVGWLVWCGLDVEVGYYFGCSFWREIFVVFGVVVCVCVLGLLVECGGG